MFSMAPLLMYSEQVPVRVRDALKTAFSGNPPLRAKALAAAARILHQESGLECGDVRELVGLPEWSCA